MTPAGVGVGISRTVGVHHLIVAGDENHPDGDLTLVDAVDPVHGGDDGRQPGRHGPTVVCGVLPGGGHNGAVGSKLGAGERLHGDLPITARVEDRKLTIAIKITTEVPGRIRISKLRFEIGNVMDPVIPTIGVDKDRATRSEDHGVQSRGCPIDHRHRLRVVESFSTKGLDLRIPHRQLGRHHLGSPDRKPRNTTVGHGKFENDVGLRPFVRRLGQHHRQRSLVKGHRAIGPRHDEALFSGGPDGRFVDIDPHLRVGASGDESGSNKKQCNDLSWRLHGELLGISGCGGIEAAVMRFSIDEF